ncbi:MAG: glycosyltransferase [Paludibacteraceae bacterium]|nr:glycosyltransferase [Paludibacteraceae bacterium]
MKVLVVSNQLPSRRYPMNGIFAIDQAKALAEAGVEVVVFAIDTFSLRWRRRIGIWEEEREGLRCYGFRIPIGNVGYKMTAKIGGWMIRRLYEKVFVKRGETAPDYIHTHFASEFGAALAKKCNIPLIITEHSSRVQNEALEGYKEAKHVIAVSNKFAETLEGRFGIKCEMVPNIVDYEAFRLAKERKAVDGRLRMATTARLIKGKGIEVTLEAMKSLEFAELEIIGDGPYRKELGQRAKELGIEKRVKFDGMLKREEIGKRYEEADCFVLTSESETFGVAYIEAMATGLPVIATRCGGPEDFVNDENGVMVRIGNTEETKQAIEYIYNNREKFDAKRIREFVEKNFASEVVAKKIMEYYD